MKVAIVGATGLVGKQLISILRERRFPLTELRLLASGRSPGLTPSPSGNVHSVEPLSPSQVAGVDICFFAATTEVSREYAPLVAGAGGIAIDKSSAFRSDPRVPLVVPEINGEAVSSHNGIIASPNCSTIQLVLVLAPLEKQFGLRRVVVSTYQSVSGTGKQAMDELREQSAAVLCGREPLCAVYPHPIAFNLLPAIDSLDADGHTGEELKLLHETRRILGQPDLLVSSTCVRVPVFTGHSESILVETRERASLQAVREALSLAPRICVVDEPAKSIYPTPLHVAGKDDVHVGRIRRDPSSETGIWLWAVADNLRTGAALNAVRIAEHICGQPASSREVVPS